MITRPYDLDLSDPFHRAIAIILTYLVPSHQTYIVARSEYIDTEQPKGEWINLNLQETVVEDARKLEPEQMKEIEGINRIRDATRDIRKAMALFNEVDKDGSGELDEEEFEYLMQVLGMDLSEGKVKEVMAEYDVDGGGIIEMHEFLLFLRNQQKEAGKRLKELTEYPILISGLQYNLPPPAIHVVNVPQDYTPSQTNNASMAHMSSGHSMISAAGSVGSNESFKGGQSSSIIVHSVVNMQHGTSKSIDKINKPHFIKYNPPRHGLLKLNVVDGFTQKESYRVISPGDRGNIMEIAKQSGDVLQMTSFGVQNYKIRLNEALGFVQTMSKENANKISILKTILPHMSSATDARQVVSKVLCNNKIDINRLKREIGQAYRVIMGQPDGFYTLDLSHEMDRFCLNRLLELSMTRAHLRSVKFGTLGYGKLGDTSQKGNWSCFRNELLNKKPIVITIQFASPLPKAGRVEFDFVSLNRATSDSFVLNDLRFTNLLVKSYLLRISDRYKALSILKKTKHQCEKCIYGDGKTMYETPKDRALEIGLHMSAFYEHLPDRFDEYERYRAREGVKVSWEYDPEIIQLTLSNMGEIYTIPSIFTLSEAEANAKKNSQAATRLGSTDGVGTAAAAAAAARGVGGKKLLNVAKKVKMVSNLSTEGKADGIKKGSLVDVLAVPSKPSSPQVIEPVIDTLASGSYSARTSSSDSVLSSSRAPSAFPSARGGSGSGQPSARKNTDLGSGVVTTTIDNTENFKLESDEDTNELLSSGSDTDNDTEVAQYLVDSPDYKPKWDGVDWGGGMFPTTPHGGGGSAGGFNSGDKSGDRGGGAGLSGGTGGSGGGVGSKSRPSLLNNMMGGKGKVGEITRKNTMANLPPAALTGPQYHPSLLRENTLVLGNDLRPYNSRGGEMGGIGGNLNKEMSTKGLGAGDGVLKTTAGAMAQSFYIKSLPPDKKPLNETYNRYLCLLASRNVQGPAKAAKTLEILLDIFEYCYLYARHLEVLVLLFEEYGRYKHADHFGTYRVELVVQLFSNVVDVYNFEIVLRRLTAYEVACVIGRIGLLNLFNPMKPEGSYELDLSRREERVCLHASTYISINI
ncbi:hypothetical protein EON65_21675 [archaeon]|nr:MAG: hypothetical protein EON65_21675 [archaeon]